MNKKLEVHCETMPTCYDCPIKMAFPKCGRGWHVAYDGNGYEQDLAMKLIEFDENKEE